MKLNQLTSLLTISVALVFMVMSSGCRGGWCNSCGGGYNYGGYAPQQPNCGCGPGYQQGGGVAPQGTYVQPGYVQPGYVQPGVVPPQQIIPSQTQPGAIFNNGSGTR